MFVQCVIYVAGFIDILPVNEEMSLEISFDPLGRKLKPIFSEAFDCKNQVDVLKMKWQIKCYGRLTLLQ